MFRRKYIFIAVAVVLFAGLIIAAALLWMPAPSIPSDAKDSRASEGKDEIRAAPTVPDSSDDGSSSSTSDRKKTSGDTLVRGLLNTFKKKPLFGNYLLKGIIASDDAPELSRATIEDIDSGASRIYSIYAMLPDESQIVDIRQDYIILQKNGARKRIYFTSQSIQGGRRITGWRSPSTGYERIKDNEYNLNPYKVFKGDAGSILDFSMKVHSRDGREEGIEISDIQHNALARELGLKENDVLLEVNGESLNGLYESVKACINANYSDDLQLKIRRGDQIIPVTYHLYWQGKGQWTTGDILNSKAVSSLFKNGLASSLF
jgi:hypothetical protein